MSYEHRPTHGAFSSIQVNGKLGTGKPAGPTSADKNNAKKQIDAIRKAPVKNPRVGNVQIAAPKKPAKPPAPTPMPSPRMKIKNMVD
jgi:hypothetical protein